MNLVKHVAQSVDLSASLKRHRDDIIGIAKTDVVVFSGTGVGSGPQHGVNDVESLAVARGLRSFASKV
jgi:hypothetical protein